MTFGCHSLRKLWEREIRFKSLIWDIVHEITYKKITSLSNFTESSTMPSFRTKNPNEGPNRYHLEGINPETNKFKDPRLQLTPNSNKGYPGALPRPERASLLLESLRHELHLRAKICSPSYSGDWLQGRQQACLSHRKSEASPSRVIDTISKCKVKIWLGM